jgi:hypothetical protein
VIALIFGIVSWSAMFFAFLWSARSPDQVVAIRRSMLLDDVSIAVGDIWVLRGLGAFTIACVTWATVVSGHSSFVWIFVPAVIVLHLFVEGLRRYILRRVAGRFWLLRLTAVLAWALSFQMWRSGAIAMASVVALAGVVIFVRPAPAAYFFANYAPVEKQVAMARYSGWIGCVMSVLVVTVLSWLAIRHL